MTLLSGLTAYGLFHGLLAGGMPPAQSQPSIQLNLESQVRRMMAFEQAKIKGLPMATEMTTYISDG
jgi:hypothetical protein